MAKRPRILHVLSSLSTYGAEHAVANLVRTLPADFEVAVMTMYTPPPRVLATFEGTLLDIARRRGDRTGSFFPHMVRAIRRWRPEIVHTHVHNGKYWGRLAALSAGARVIVHTEHNSDFGAHPAVGAVNRWLHAHTARVVALSREHARRLAGAERLPPSKIAIIPNGIGGGETPVTRAAARQTLGLHEDDARAVILCVGRFESPKNQRLAVEAFAASSVLRRRARLLFAGDGNLEPSVRDAAAAADLNDVVGFLGYRPDVRAIFPAADALVIPSRNEAMPLVALEAMLAGLPIVSTPWSGSAELFEDGRLACVAPDFTSEALGRTLEALLDDPETAADRARLARAVAVTEYTIEGCARRHSELYRALLA